LYEWGGGNYFGGVEYTDSWTWNATVGWTNITLTDGSLIPTFRLQGTFTYDDGNNGNSAGIYMFGGTDDYGTSAGTTYSQYWVWS
jgi:hypothetical protein